MDPEHEKAAAFVMPFGRYKGHTVAFVASDYKGLKYLNWIRESIHLDKEVWNAVCTYLRHFDENVPRLKICGPVVRTKKVRTIGE